MATFHIVGQLDLSILLSYSKIVQVIENILCVMFSFRQRSMHVYKDVSYAENNIVLNSIYQISDVNSEGMFWMVTNGKY